MPYDYPKPLTYNAREDIDRLWEDLWRIVEQLRLAEEEMARREKAAEAAGSKAGAGSTASAKPKHLLPFGKVTGNTSSSAKTATVPGVTELKDGVACYIINDATSTASGWTINDNGLGAKHVYNSQGGGAITTTYAANYCMLFIYNEARTAGTAAGTCITATTPTPTHWLTTCGRRPRTAPWRTDWHGIRSASQSEQACAAKSSRRR